MKKKELYYLIGAVLVLLVLFFLFAWITGRKVEKGIERSNKPLVEKFMQIQERVEGVEERADNTDLALEGLDEVSSEIKDDIDFIKDSLEREIHFLSSELRALKAWQAEQKKLNEYWAGKTLELLNWKLDLEEQGKQEKIQKQEREKKAREEAERKKQEEIERIKQDSIKAVQAAEEQSSRKKGSKMRIQDMESVKP